MSDDVKNAARETLYALLVIVFSVTGSVVGAYAFLDDRLDGLRETDAALSLTLSEATARLDKRVAVIEGNRFSSADGLALWEQIASIKERIAMMPTEVPPAWFLDEVRETQRIMREVQAELSGVKERLVRIEARADGGNEP